MDGVFWIDSLNKKLKKGLLNRLQWLACFVSILNVPSDWLGKQFERGGDRFRQ